MTIEFIFWKCCCACFQILASLLNPVAILAQALWINTFFNWNDDASNLFKGFAAMLFVAKRWWSSSSGSTCIESQGSCRLCQARVSSSSGISNPPKRRGPGSSQSDLFSRIDSKKAGHGALVFAHFTYRSVTSLEWRLYYKNPSLLWFWVYATCTVWWRGWSGSFETTWPDRGSCAFLSRSSFQSPPWTAFGHLFLASQRQIISSSCRSCRKEIDRNSAPCWWRRGSSWNARHPEHASSFACSINIILTSVSSKADWYRAATDPSSASMSCSIHVFMWSSCQRLLAFKYQCSKESQVLGRAHFCSTSIFAEVEIFTRCSWYSSCR